LTPGSRIRDGIRDEQPGSYILELRNHFFVVKILKFFDADAGSGIEKFGTGIRQGKKSDPGYGTNILFFTFFWLITIC
jgi:hypothetical protein